VKVQSRSHFPSLCTFITIPPTAVVNPQGFPWGIPPPLRAAAVAFHLTPIHSSPSPTKMSDRQPVGSPVAYHHGHRSRHQSRHDGIDDLLRHQQHRYSDTAGVFLVPRWTPGQACTLGVAAAGDVGKGRRPGGGGNRAEGGRRERTKVG
jgi:hypothetical protein